MITDIGVFPALEESTAASARRGAGTSGTFPPSRPIAPRTTSGQGRRPPRLQRPGNRAASATASVWTAKLAKYRPAASLITVTLAGSEGRSRDQRTSMSPIFGRRRRPLARILNFAFAVNRTASRLRADLPARPLGGGFRAAAAAPGSALRRRTRFRPLPPRAESASAGLARAVLRDRGHKPAQSGG